MYSEEVYANLRTWSGFVLSLLRSQLPLMKPVSGYEGWTREQRQTLGYLVTATARASESALLLTAYGQLWDAEVIVRSVVEGSLKLGYMLQDRQHFEQRHHEYRHNLFKIAHLKDHSKIAEHLGLIPDAGQRKWKPLRDRLLSEQEYLEYSRAYPQKERRALDTRWGFTGLLIEFARSSDPLFRNFSALAHGYAMASHILHADHIGTFVPLEIDQRPEERRDAILLAHCVRLLSDIQFCLQIRLSIGYRFVEHPLEPVIAATEEMRNLLASFGPVYEQWMNVEYPEN